MIFRTLERKHLELDKDSIKYIGKESNGLEQSEIFGVSKKDIVEYVDYQKKLRKIIENLTLEKALDLGISRRTFFYLKKKLQSFESIKLKSKILKKMMKNMLI